MPELPEVETVVRGLRAPLVGRRIESVWAASPRVIHAPSPEEFTARLPGQTVCAVERRAKYILCRLDQGETLAIHLKMTGRLYVSQEAPPDDRWVRLRLGLDNGQSLHFSDARRFGRAYLVHDIAEVAPHLGPEPLDDAFTPAVLRDRLRGRARQIKVLLLDQSFIAGVGNIYADEALHRARIHPLRRSDTLSEAEIDRLYQTVRAVLFAGIDHEGASVNWYRKPDGTPGESQHHFAVYDRENQPCLTCGLPIHKIRVGQRGTHFCPNCQPEKLTYGR